MMDHVEDFLEYEELGATFFTSIPGFMQTNQGYFTWTILAGGTGFLAYYVWAQLQLKRQGYDISPQKVYLLVSTGAVSMFTWGFNTFGEAFFIMHFWYDEFVWSVRRKQV